MFSYDEKVHEAFTGYQDLHSHTEASYRDAITTVDEYAEVAKMYGRRAFSITDHGNQMRLFQGIKARAKDEKQELKKALQRHNVDEKEIDKILGSIRDTDSIRCPTEKMRPFVQKYEDIFVEAAHNSLQFVPGIELYFAPSKEDKESSYHLLLLAKDWEGQKTIFKISNLAQLNKTQSGLPRTTWEDLERFVGPGTPGHEHVFASTACVGGYVPSLLLQPWRLAEKQHQISQRIENLGPGYTQEDIDRGEARYQELKEQASTAKERLRKLNKAQKTDYPKKIAALEKRLQKADDAYHRACDAMEQTTLFSSAENSQTEEQKVLHDKRDKLKKDLEKLLAEAKEAKEFADHRQDIEKAAAEIPKELEAAKQELELIKKGARPYLRLMEKCAALEQEKVSADQAYANACEAAQKMDHVFGHGYFFIELQNHGIPAEEYALPLLCRMIRELKIPPVVTNDTHYARKEDERKRSLVAAMRFPNKTVFDVQSEPGMDQLYIKTGEEMLSLADSLGENAGIWRAGIKNSGHIASMCHVYYDYSMHLPEFDVSASGCKTPIEFLDQFCHKMIPQKYPMTNLNPEQKQQMLDKIEKQLQYELGVIEKMGYGSYIAIVQDFIFYGRKIGGEAGIGPGRGSGAGSIVCYLSDITDVDPLRYNLIFERFLNPERVSMPDIDSDIAPSIRSQVIDYVAQKYAYRDSYPVEELRGTVCNISTESQLAARAAVRAVARVTNVPYEIADKVAKMIPQAPGMTIQKAVDENAELVVFCKTDSVADALVKDAMLVEGIPCQTGVHAAGVIVADKPISEYAPMFWNDEKHCWVIQSDMVACEKTLGMLKIDFLGLTNLDIINTTVRYIELMSGKRFDWTPMTDVNDADVIENIYANGQTNGVFQFESEGIKTALMNFKPNSIDDIILMNAAYRPGPMDSIPEFTAVKLGQAQPEYLVPEMESILGVTYGSAIYQEQIMQLFQMVGFSLGEADIIRRAMSKKHLNEIEAAKDKFVAGMLERGADPVKLEQYWQRLLAFASYAFNKSHAAAYSIVSYRTAWLKYYYPSEFLAATMSYRGLGKIPIFANDCKRYGIRILKPSINQGVPFFAPLKGNEKAIRYGLGTIMNVASAAQLIYDLRDCKPKNPSAHHLGPCKDFRDFVIRASVYGIDGAATGSLILSGAMDELMQERENRHTYYENSDALIKKCRAFVKSLTKQDESMSQDALYFKTLQEWQMPPLQFFPEYDSDTLLDNEMQLLGLYVSGNPLDKYMAEITNLANRDKKIADIGLEDTRQDLQLAGRIREVQLLYTKKDHLPFAKFILDDESGSITGIIFNHQYTLYKEHLRSGNIVSLSGRIRLSENNGDQRVEQINVNSIKTLNDRK